MKIMKTKSLKIIIGLLFAVLILHLSDRRVFATEVDPVEYDLIIPDGTTVTDTIFELKKEETLKIVDDIIMMWI